MISENLKTVLATTFVFYLKAHKFHWNVMGNDFAQYHEFFGELYEETYAAVDPIAEFIRTQGVFSPGSLTEFAEMSNIKDSVDDLSDGMAMVQTLATDNQLILNILNQAYDVSEAERTFDVSDMLAGRIAAHKKHGWMLNAFLNRQQG